MQEAKPAVIRMKLLFPGGEGWQDVMVLRWTDQGHPVVLKGGKELVLCQQQWRA